MPFRLRLLCIAMTVVLLHPGYARAASAAPQVPLDGLYRGAFAPLPHVTIKRIDSSLYFMPTMREATSEAF